MKKLGLVCAAVLGLSAFFTSCGSTKVERVDSNTQIDLSGYWNDTDVKIVCESLIRDCSSSPRIAQFEAKNKRAPVVIIGKIANKSSEHLDTTIVARRFQTAIINSGVMEFVADAEQRTQLREEKVDQAEFATDDSAKAIAQELGADYMLQGSVRTIVDSANNQTVRTYYVDMQLLDIETNKILWQGENNEIKKVVKNAKAKL